MITVKHVLFLVAGAVCLWLIVVAVGSRNGTTYRTTDTSSPPHGTAVPRGTERGTGVPDVTAHDLAAAKTILTRRGLKARVRFIQSARKPGIVLAVAPAAGSRIPADSLVHLTVAEGVTKARH
jgi:beta-lactam-binding protein with PASTA domain